MIGDTIFEADTKLLFNSLETPSFIVNLSNISFFNEIS